MIRTKRLPKTREQDLTKSPSKSIEFALIVLMSSQESSRTQCKEIADKFKARANEFGEVIKPYEEAQKVVAGESVLKPKVITCVVKFYDEKILKKLADFCTKNGCELSVK